MKLAFSPFSDFVADSRALATFRLCGAADIVRETRAIRGRSFRRCMKGVTA